MTGWLTVIQQMLGRGGLTNCFNSNRLLLVSEGTPYNLYQRVGEKTCMCKCIRVYVCIYVWWKRWGAVVGEKGASHYPLHVVWGQTTGFNQLRCMCLSTCMCVCVSEWESALSRDGDVAGNASASDGRPGQPEPPLHCLCLSPPYESPSISLCSPILHPQPPSETRDKSQWKLLQGECSGRILLFCCLCRLSSLQFKKHYLYRVPRCFCSDKQCCCCTVG